MKTKLLAVMLLAGGTMFAQSRFSVGVGVGGYGGGFYQEPAPYAYGVPPCPGVYDANGYCVEGYGYAAPFYGGYGIAPRFDNHFEGRGFEGGRNRDVGRGRNGGGQNRGQGHGGGNRR